MAAVLVSFWTFRSISSDHFSGPIFSARFERTACYPYNPNVTVERNHCLCSSFPQMKSCSNEGSRRN
jgi:hypothetical protein